MTDRNRSNKRSVIELDIDDIPVNTEPEEQKSSKRKGTASGTTASGKKALTVPQLRALSGKSPMAVEESKKLEDSIDQNGTPDNQPAVDIVEETDAAAATIASPSDSSSTVVGLVTVNTADNGGEDTTEGRGSVDTTMNAERHNAQSGAVTVVGGNESPAVSMNNSATSTGYSESPEGRHISHAPAFIRPDEYGRPADNDSDGEDASATSANTILIIDPTHAEVGTAAFSSAPANTVATEGRDSVDTTMNAERHNAQSGAVTVVGGNESPAVSMNNSATSTGYSESPEGRHISHAPAFIRPDEYGRPADNDSDGEDASATSANTILIIDPTHAEVGTAAFSSAPANTVATEGRDSVDTTINAERHNAQSGAVAVVGGNESPAVSVSYSASSTAYSSSITEFLIRSDT